MEEGHASIVIKRGYSSYSGLRWRNKSREREYITRLCRAFIDYGAPAHHLEENLLTAAANLGVGLSAQLTAESVLLSFSDDIAPTLPLISGDWETVHLGVLADVYRVFDRVIAYRMGVEEAIAQLTDISERNNQYSDTVLVFVYGLTCCFVGTLIFGARPLDMPVMFTFGIAQGYVKKKVTPSCKYRDVLELVTTVGTSCLARALGSLPGDVFCFPALSQAPLVLMLPGFTIACGTLQLASTNKGAGSSRIVYAIVYAVILGLGVTVGSSLYGSMNPNATSESYCPNTMPVYYPYVYLVPLVICIITLSQGRLRQMPIMAAISISGFAVSTVLRKRLVTEVATLCGAFALGCLVNLYSAISHRSAAEILLAGLFVQVPSGLGAHGSLVGGITNANVMVQATLNTTVQTTVASVGGDSIIDLRVPISMARVAIMIVLGLRLSSWLAYCCGQRKLNC